MSAAFGRPRHRAQPDLIPAPRLLWRDRVRTRPGCRWKPTGGRLRRSADRLTAERCRSARSLSHWPRWRNSHGHRTRQETNSGQSIRGKANPICTMRRPPDPCTGESGREWQGQWREASGKRALVRHHEYRDDSIKSVYRRLSHDAGRARGGLRRPSGRKRPGLNRHAASPIERESLRCAGEAARGGR